MKIIVSSFGEWIKVSEENFHLSYPIVFGTHSCGGELTLHKVSEDWRALVCRTCAWRHVIHHRVIFTEELRRYFEETLAGRSFLVTNKGRIDYVRRFKVVSFD